MTDLDPGPLFDRELSWIAFNGRVLQEAQNPEVPLFEGLAFLAIVSWGDEQISIASADWMVRNLTRRIEVAVPVLDDEIKDEIRTVLDLQLSDNRKARRIDRGQTNAFLPARGTPVRSRIDHYRFLEAKLGSA